MVAATSLIATLAVVVPTAPAQASTTPITVTMTSTPDDLAENGGTKDVAVVLDRAVSSNATVNVPLALRGAAPGVAYSVELHSSSDSGTVFVAGPGRRRAQNPVLSFAAGARRAVLRFTGADNEHRSQPVVAVMFGWGNRAPHGDKDEVAVDPAHMPVVFAITDDETGPLTVPLDSPLRPDGVGAGEDFRLLFVTSRGVAPSSADIDFYNRLAQGAVARRGLAGLRPYAGLMRVLGSTSTVAARDNTGTHPAVEGPGEPVHWLQGARVADDYADLYDGAWDNYSGDATTEDGTRLSSWIRVWTGSTTVGTADPWSPLGNGADSDGVRLVTTAWNNHRDGSNPLTSGTIEDIDDEARTRRFGHRYYVMSPVFTVESRTVTVTMTATPEDVDEATGTKDVAIELSRSLSGGEVVTVPIAVTGASVSSDYTFGLHGAHRGVRLLTDGVHSAQNPAVRFGAGASRAVLRFDPHDNSKRTQPWVTIQYGAEAEPTGVDIAALEGGPISFAITDDETGDITVPYDSSLRPNFSLPGSEFRLLFVTSDERDATSGEIGDYDAFVRSLAAHGHPDIVAYAGFFKALGDTPTVEMVAHNGIDLAGFIDVYWLGGRHSIRDRVAGSYRQFLTGRWISDAVARPRDEHGDLVAVESEGYWTSGFGSAAAGVSHLDSSTNPIGSGHRADAATPRSLYALSPVFKTAPVPTASITAGSDVVEGGAANFTVHVSPAPWRDLELDLLVSGDTLVSRFERGVRSPAVTVGAGETSASFSVATLDDAFDDRDGRVDVMILTGVGYQVSLIASGASVAVKDDEPTTVRLTAHGTGAVDEGSTSDFSVSLGRVLAAGESVTVPITFAGTAGRGSDYTVTCSGTAVTCTGLDGDDPRAVFGVGAQTATVTVAATADRVHPEADETVDVGLGTVVAVGLSGGVAAGVDAAGPLTIASVAPEPVVEPPPIVNPPVKPPPTTTVRYGVPAVTFESDTASASESVGTHNVVIGLSPLPESMLVAFYTVEGSASPGTDYEPMIGAFLVVRGTSETSIAIKIDDDSAAEPPETVVVRLLDGDGYTVGETNTHTLEIIDND